MAGGSGVVPLMAMIRHRSASAVKPPARLLYSSRNIEDVIYKEELDRLAAAEDGLVVAHSFVEAAGGLLVDLGYDPSWIKTERFGATGG